MHLKRYRSSTVRDALARAREELGPDALVLSTELVPRSGWRGALGRREVQVTVAAERQVSEERTPGLVNRLAAAGSGLELASLVARLRAAGFDDETARAVVSALPAGRLRGASIGDVSGALASALAALVAPAEPAPGIEVFVGPPGAGKTTTVAKVAAQARARRGSRFSLVAADGFRVGAVEQLRLYADILGAPFVVARTATELEGAFAMRRPMLVDTAGRSPHDGSAPMLDLLAGRPDIRTHLVVPATTTARDFTRLVDRYRVARPDRIVLTRMDEAESISALVPALRDCQLPVSYFGTGQRVPEDLQQGTSSMLAACVLGEFQQTQGLGS